MNDYVNPYTRDDNLDHIIMQVETKDVNFQNKPRRAAESIADLVEGMVSVKMEIEVFGIISRGDEWKKSRGSKSLFEGYV